VAYDAAHLCAEALAHLNAAMCDQHGAVSIHADGSRHGSRRAVKPAHTQQAATGVRRMAAMHIAAEEDVRGRHIEDRPH
jgi:hypothetical protein